MWLLKKAPSNEFAAEIEAQLQQIVKPCNYKNSFSESCLLGFSVVIHMRRSLQNKAAARVVARYRIPKHSVCKIPLQRLCKLTIETRK